MSCTTQVKALLNRSLLVINVRAAECIRLMLQAGMHAAVVMVTPPNLEIC